MKRLENLSEEMNGTILEAVAHFAMSVEDYRRTKKGNFKHPLSDLILLVVLCYLDGQIYLLHYVIVAETILDVLETICIHCIVNIDITIYAVLREMLVEVLHGKTVLSACGVEH